MIPDVLLEYFLTRTLRNLPALIALVICAIMVHSNRQHHPRAARLAAFAFCWFLFVDLLALFWYTIGEPMILVEAPVREIIWVSETVLSCLEGVGYFLVLFAFNAARRPYRPPEFYDDPRDFEERLKMIQDDAFTAEEPKRAVEKPRLDDPKP